MPRTEDQSSQCLRGLSGSTARCVCNLVYDLVAWDAFPERQRCWRAPAARAAPRAKSPAGHSCNGDAQPRGAGGVCWGSWGSPLRKRMPRV